MPFPATQRVVYDKNILDTVICQLRFPPILRIDAEIPAAFQERIRGEYPSFKETGQLNLPIPQDLKLGVPGDVLRIGVPTGVKNYEFSSDDSQWTINLSRTFLGLTTKKYARWEGFKEKLQGPLEALLSIYSPAFFSRIGLRYIDIINRSALNLTDVDWTELLKPHLLGVLASPDVGKRVANMEAAYEIALLDGVSKVRVVTRLVRSVQSDEQYYMVDSDFFDNARNSIDQALAKLDYLHERATRLLQWCITPRLHQAMEPKPL